MNRVMKARRSGRVACGCWVMVGKAIVRRDSKWVCIDCAVATIRASHAIMDHRTGHDHG